MYHLERTNLLQLALTLPQNFCRKCSCHEILPEQLQLVSFIHSFIHLERGSNMKNGGRNDHDRGNKDAKPVDAEAASSGEHVSGPPCTNGRPSFQPS